MNACDEKMYRNAHELHTLFYSVPEESRNGEFWEKIDAGVKRVLSSNPHNKSVKYVVGDVLVLWERQKFQERIKINSEREAAAARAREENERAAVQARKLAEVERLEDELTRARAAL